MASRACVVLAVVGAVTLAGVARGAASLPRPKERAKTMTGTPLSLHPDNPHYFLFRGRPTILITSGEHYGAVLNRAFDFVTYLATLQKDRLNLTRVFTGGGYVEPAGAFNIASNTLAPAAGEFLCPWKRSETPGYRGGGNRFDLTAWDPAYFARLAAFLEAAAARDIVVELCLFCPFYDDAQWVLSPWYPGNNVNGTPDLPRTDVYTLDKSGPLLAYQEALVRKLVAETNRFDNLYYEICNEPYFGGVTAGWQAHSADVIVAAEARLPKRHLISQNIANGAEEVKDPHAAVKILNFHYAHPPEAVALNYSLGRVVGENETGFHGTGDTYYRIEAWEFLLAGGGLYNNLDYSFAVGHEDGSFQYPDTQPGGGSAALRRQLRVLRDFLYGFDFVRMKPEAAVSCRGVQGEPRARALSEPGRQYAVYVTGGRQAEVVLDLPAGQYQATWLDPVTGKTTPAAEIRHTGGALTRRTPEYTEDIALRLVRKAKTG